MIKILLSPTVEEARKVNADVTIEAEYGKKTIKGKLYTSAHHGENAGNKAPCIDINLYTLLSNDELEDIIILISHIDLDTILGLMNLLGLSQEVDAGWAHFCEAAAFIDVNGIHRINDIKVDILTRQRLNAYYYWNFIQGRKERITETTDVIEQIKKAAKAINSIVFEDKLIEEGKKWAKEREAEVESKLYEENEKYRIFNTDKIFCGGEYYSKTLEKIIPAIISYNQQYKSITLSFEDGGKEINAVTIMQELFGSEAGGRSGIAGTPRGKEYMFVDVSNIARKLEELL
jgi:hypothetical protein